MDDIELKVARAVSKAHLVEALLHDRGQWTMGLGAWGVSKHDLVVPCTKFIEDHGDQVVVEATFPPHCWTGLRPNLLMLFLDGETMAVKEIAHPGDGGFVTIWCLSVQVVEAAA